MDLWQDMQAHLDDLAQQDLLRSERVIESPVGPTVTIGGREVLCLCSNDYLGLANDPAVRAAAAEAIERWGVGAGASRLVSGTSRPHAMLEERLAAFKHAPACVVTSTGWMANHAAIHALVGKGDLILCDKLNHASILDACLSSGARVRTYPHCDVARARAILERHRGEHGRCVIVTDSLFSMDGDLAPLAELAQIKKQFDAILMIDEAHATGVLGANGRGVAELLGVEADTDVTVGTLSKALGAMGGFVAGPRVLIDTIRNVGRPYVYTTALPPAICAAAMKSLEIVEREPQRRQRLLAMAQTLRQSLAEKGLTTGQSVGCAGSDRVVGGQVLHTESDGPTTAAHDAAVPPSCTQIVPIIIGPAAKAIDLSRRLLDAGFLVPAIRPPTVPPNSSRLRVSLSSEHEQGQLDRFIESLRRVPT